MSTVFAAGAAGVCAVAWYRCRREVAALRGQLAGREAVRQAELRGHALFDHLAAGCQVIDRDWNYVYVNEALAGLAGQPGKQLRGRPVFEAFPGLEGSEAQAQLVGCMTQRVARDAECAWTTPGGGTVWLALSMQPVPEGLFVLSVDITHRKQAEDMLRRAASLASQAGEMAGLGAWELDLAQAEDNPNPPLHWSDEVFRIFGYQPGDIVPTSRLFFDHVHPEDRARVEQASRDAIRTGAPYQVEHRIVLRDGRERVVEERAELTAAPGGRRQLVGAVQDITDRKLAEAAVEWSSRRNGLLSDAAARLLRGGDPQNLVEELCGQVMGFLDCDLFLCFVVAEGDRKMRLHACAGVAGEHRDRLERAEGGSVMSGAEDRYRQRILAEPLDVAQDARAALLASMGVRAYCCHPLVGRDDLIGTVAFGTRSRDRFRPEEVDVMAVVADLVSMAMSRARVLQALAAREQQFRVLFESSSDAILVAAAPDWRITACNRSAIAMFRAAEESDLRGRGPWELSPEQQPDGRASFELTREHVRGALGEGSASFDWVHRRLDGELFPAAVLLTRFELNGVTYLQASVRDVTERQRAEEQLRKLAAAVEQSPVSILITDRAGNIEFVNPRFTVVTGYTLEEVRGKNPRVLKSGEMPPETYRQLWETLLAGEVWHGVFHNRRKDGTLFWEAASISPLRDASGAVTHFVGVKEDVTEKRLTEAKLLRAQRLESIGSLASGIAHDLNNILSPIVMCSSLLEDEESPETRRELAQTIESSALRAVGIVKQLLGFARGKEGRRSPLQLRHLIREMVKIMRETFPRNIQVTEEIETELWQVVADPTQMHQVLLNLCVNARDAMSEGGRLVLRAENEMLDELFVSMHPQASVGPYVRLAVQDTGTGISDAVRDHIFETFFTTKGEGQGTGLGLTTVQGIVRNHQGFIQFTSQEGVGTTFEVYLPACPEAEGTAVVSRSPRPVARAGGELILVVDDEEGIRNSTTRLLERHGYAVLRAEDGIDALARFTDSRGRVRAVVTDLMMPAMDGMTLCRALRRLSPETPLILSSGGLTDSAGAETARGLAQLGVFRILHKPHNAEVLLVALAEALAEGAEGERKGDTTS